MSAVRPPPSLVRRVTTAGAIARATLALVAVAACGGRTLDDATETDASIDATGDDARADDAATDAADATTDASADATPADGDADAAPTTPCPAAIPADGAACGVAGLWCQYGDDPHGRCASTAYCDVGAGSQGALEWHVTAADPSCAAADGCPATFATDGGPCAPDAGARSCDYAEGRCACVSCAPADGGAEGRQWSCRAWGDVPTLTLDDAGDFVDAAPTDGAVACPAIAPRLGAYCDAGAVLCGYDSCTGVSLGWYEWCRGGTWGIGPQTDLCNLQTCAP